MSTGVAPGSSKHLEKMMTFFKAYRCGQCHNEGSTAGHTCDKCGSSLSDEDFLGSSKAALDAQLAAATGGTPDSKKLLDAQLAAAASHSSDYGSNGWCKDCGGRGCITCDYLGYAPTPLQASWHLEDVDRMSDGTCLWCHGFGCAHCGSTGGY
jgi:hypothetical protein